MNAEKRRIQRGTMQKRTTLLFEKESYLIRGACFSIYEKFRNTQKESVYQRSLLEELKSKGLKSTKGKATTHFSFRNKSWGLRAGYNSK